MSDVSILLACVVSFVLVSFIFLNSLKQRKKMKDLISSIGEIERLVIRQGNLNNVYADELSGMGKHLSKIQGLTSNYEDRLQRLEEKQPDLSNYQQANLIFQKGGTIDEVVRTCSLSLAEAKFVKSMLEKEQ